MTDYATKADIELNLKGVTFSASTSVTSDGLVAMISQESSVIDQHISSRYALPITEASALLFLKKICIDLVVYRVTKVLQPKNATPIPQDKAIQDISHSSVYREAMRMLRSVSDGSIALPVEEQSTRTIVSSTAVDDDQETTFELEEQQW